MTEIKIEWTMENILRFAKYNSFLKNRFMKIVFIAFFAFYIILMGLCISAFIMLGYSYMLVIAIALTVFVVGYVLAAVFMMKNYSKRIYQANIGDSMEKVQIDDEKIIVFKESEAVGKISWEKIASILLDEKARAVYLLTDDNALLLLEFKNITAGCEGDFRSLLEAKIAKLSKKA